MLVVLGLLLGVGLAAAQQPPPDDPLLRWMDRAAQRLLDKREAAISGINTVADAERRKQVVREKIMAIMGGLLMLAYSGPGKWALGRRADS